MSLWRRLRVWQALTLLMSAVCGRQKIARGAFRHDLRLHGASPLSEATLASPQQCLMLCAKKDGCRALQYEALSSGRLRCQTFNVSACVGATGTEERLVASPGVHYMDVPSDLDVSKRESQHPFWEDAGCRMRGYCAPACAATAEGDFCPESDLYCTALTPATYYVCLENTCQLNPSLWKINSNNAILPKWQTWLVDSHLAKLKKITSGACSLKFDLRVQKLGSVAITISSTDGHRANGRDYGLIAFVFDIGGAGNSETAIKRRVQVNGAVQESTIVTENTPDILSTTEERRYLLSWCDGQLRFGPEQQPDLVAGSYTEDKALSLLLLDISLEAEVARLKMEKDVVDIWLYRDTGVTANPEFLAPTNSLILRQLSGHPLSQTTIQFDVMCNGNVWVVFREALAPTKFHRLVLGIGRRNSRLEVVDGESVQQVDGQHSSFEYILYSTAFTTFSVSYNDGRVVVRRNGFFHFQRSFPSAMPLRYVGVGGGCCSYKTFRLAKYDPAWRTDVWVEGGPGGYVNLAGLE